VCGSATSIIIVHISYTHHTVYLPVPSALPHSRRAACKGTAAKPEVMAARRWFDQRIQCPAAGARVAGGCDVRGDVKGQRL